MPEIYGTYNLSESGRRGGVSAQRGQHGSGQDEATGKNNGKQILSLDLVL